MNVRKKPDINSYIQWCKRNWTNKLELELELEFEFDTISSSTKVNTLLKSEPTVYK